MYTNEVCNDILDTEIINYLEWIQGEREWQQH